MSEMKNRLLMQLERQMRHINRATINPEMPELTTDDLAPALRLVARARAQYLAELFRLAGATGESDPADEQLKRLQRRRVRYEELLKGAQALETAIQRGYLDVSDTSSTTDAEGQEPGAES